MKGSGNSRWHPEHHYPGARAVESLDHCNRCGLASWESRSHHHDACLLRDANRGYGEQFV